MFTNAGYIDSSHKVSFNAIKNDLSLYYGERHARLTMDFCARDYEGKDSTDKSCKALRCIFKLLSSIKKNKLTH